MRKVTVPRKITILKRTYKSDIKHALSDGGIVTKLDSAQRKDNIGSAVFRDKWKYGGVTLVNRALMQLNSTEYDNMKGYYPSIGKGWQGSSDKISFSAAHVIKGSHYDWWFTAPDGVTKLPLPDHIVGFLLREAVLDQGKVKEKCVICKDGTDYLPMPKAHKHIKGAYRAAALGASKKVKDMTPGECVLYRGTEFAYLGMYSMQIVDGSKPKRVHVLFDFTTKQLISKPHYGEELTSCGYDDPNYTKDDFSLELTKVGKEALRYHWRADYCIFAKNRKALMATLKTLCLERSGMQHDITYSDRGLVYFEQNFYRLEYGWNDDAFSLIPIKLNRITGITISTNEAPKRFAIAEDLLQNKYQYNNKIGTAEGVNTYCIIDKQKVMLIQDKEDKT